MKSFFWTAAAFTIATLTTVVLRTNEIDIMWFW